LLRRKFVYPADKELLKISERDLNPILDELDPEPTDREYEEWRRVRREVKTTGLDCLL